SVCNTPSACITTSPGVRRPRSWAKVTRSSAVFWGISIAIGAFAGGASDASTIVGAPPCVRRRLVALDLSAGEDRRDVGQHVGRGDLVVPVVADETLLDDLDLLLRFLVDDVGDEARQFDAVLLVFEQLELQRLVQTLVGAEVELLALDRQGADVVHDLAPERSEER